MARRLPKKVKGVNYFASLTWGQKEDFLRYQAWKKDRDRRRKEKFFNQPQMNRREIGFANAFFPRLVNVLMDENLGKKTTGQFNREITGAALASLNPGGWRTPIFNNDASINKAALSKVGELLGLPRMQNYLMELFAESGWTLRNGAENLAAIANQEITEKNQRTVMQANLEMYKLLFGTLSRNVNTNVNYDLASVDTGVVEDWGKTPEPMFDAKVIEATKISQDNSYGGEDDDADL